MNHTVADAATTCLKEYQILQDLVKDNGAAYYGIADNLQKLNNWASNMEIFGEPHRALNYHIIDVEEIMTLFVQLLRTI